MDLDEKLKFGTFVIALFGVPFFFYEQYVTEQREIRRYTAQFIERYRSGDIFDVQMRMLKTWNTLPLRDIVDNMPSRPVLDGIVISLIKSDDQFFSDFLYLVNYFDEAAMCVDIGACDNSIVERSLYNDAARAAELYGGAIRSIRERLMIDSFGRGLEAIQPDEPLDPDGKVREYFTRQRG